MVISIAVFIVRPFITRAMCYNSLVAAFLFAPVTSDNIQWVCISFVINSFKQFLRIATTGNIRQRGQQRQFIEKDFDG